MERSHRFKWILILLILIFSSISLILLGNILASPRELVTIKIFYGAHYFVPEANSFRNLVDRWNELYFRKEGFQVEIVDIDREDFLVNIVASNSQEVDLVFLTNFNIGLLADKLEPLDSILRQKAQDFYSPALESVKVNESIYGLPLHTVVPVLVYRGRDISNPPENWKEFKAIAKNFTRIFNPDSPTPYGAAIYCLPGVHGGVILHSIMNSIGGDISLRNLTRTIGSLKLTFQLYLDLFSEGMMPANMSSYEWTTMMRRFEANEFPMMIGWSGLLEEMNVDDVKIAPIPVGEDGIQRNARIYVIALGIPRSSTHKNEAFKFLSTLLEGSLLEEMLDLGYVPPLKSLLLNSKFPLRDQLSEILEHSAAPAINIKRSKDLYVSLSIITEWVIDKRITLAEASKMADLELRKIMP